jgi:hypothetical protein
MRQEDLERIPIGEDFEIDGDCGEYSTYLTFQEGYLLTVDRLFDHQRRELKLSPAF